MSEHVHSITDAPLKHSVEQRGRMVRYTVAMSIRIVCFILAAVVGAVWETWWAMALVAAAVVLPYVAVVNANAGGDRYMADREAAAPEVQAGLTSGEQEPSDEPLQWWEDDDAGPESQSDPQVISGERADLDDGDDPWARRAA